MAESLAGGTDGDEPLKVISEIKGAHVEIKTCLACGNLTYTITIIIFTW